MRFVVDVHLPRRLVRRLRSFGHHAIHVNDILDGSRTTDQDLMRFADENSYILLTKDADFCDAFLVSGSPRRLIRFAGGNLDNQRLIHRMEVVMAHLERQHPPAPFLIEVFRDRWTVR